MKKPTTEEIRQYLSGEYDLKVSVRPISERNHLIYLLEDAREQKRILRMINPESYRKHEWISMVEEYQILQELTPTGLGPKVYAIDTHALPFLIQEYVEAQCFNDLKPLSKEHLAGAAEAIAELNRQHISPDEFSFMNKYVEKVHQKRLRAWLGRLTQAVVYSQRSDVFVWAIKIMPLALRASIVLSKHASLFAKSSYSFHFDGAHCGNTYWLKDEHRVIFLDWQKVSWRNDPAFTLVRFAISIEKNKAVPPNSVLRTLVDAYLDARKDIAIAREQFYKIFWIRLLERAVSDLVYVVWDPMRDPNPARRNNPNPLEEFTAVVPRYLEVRELLRRYH